MLDYLLQYGLFLAETLTIVVAVAALALLVAALAARRRGGFGPERLEVRDLGARHREMKQALESGFLGARERKAAAKARKREAKAREKEGRSDRPRVFVLDFKGDMRASAVASLREEVTAVLAFARPEDEVLVRLENAGGMVHEHGFAASQLMRVRERGIPLTVSVDRIAASGGYMMACVADRIVAAPFAILGSIGVLAQIPNFHRLLDRHGIDFEQFKEASTSARSRCSVRTPTPTARSSGRTSRRSMRSSSTSSSSSARGSTSRRSPPASTGSRAGQRISACATSS